MNLLGAVEAFFPQEGRKKEGEILGRGFFTKQSPSSSSTNPRSPEDFMLQWNFGGNYHSLNPGNWAREEMSGMSE
jgi:hypothetical protein